MESLVSVSTSTPSHVSEKIPSACKFWHGCLGYFDGLNRLTIVRRLCVGRLQRARPMCDDKLGGSSSKDQKTRSGDPRAFGVQLGVQNTIPLKTRSTQKKTLKLR